MHKAFLGVATLALIGCSPEVETTGDNALAVSNFVAPTAAPEPPPHRYGFREGSTYGYITAVSEEDQKTGKATGEVVMFRYHGNEDGIYRLTSVDAAGREFLRYECTKPCVAIKVFGPAGPERIAYAPDSIIGSAFDDAMAGQLEQGQVAKAHITPTATSEWAGKYDGDFEGNATGSVDIKDRGKRLRVSIGVGSPRCTGGIEFTANQPSDSLLVHTMPDDGTYGRCTIRLTRDGQNLNVSEDNCLYYHGAECSFNGDALK
jgi:hypothetical protein